jgi:type VI secretion system secreted protein Hcp
MSLPFHMTVNGEKLGAISEGASNVIGRENTIQCFALEQNIVKPYNQLTTEPTGVARHNPVKVTKEFDRASPMLYQALCEGDMLTIKLEFYKTVGANQVIYFTIEFTDALIVEMRPHVPPVENLEDAQSQDMEDISFVYRMVKWSHTLENTEAEIDWLNPATA